jgi:hypothetical protein
MGVGQQGLHGTGWAGAIARRAKRSWGSSSCTWVRGRGGSLDAWRAPGEVEDGRTWSFPLAAEERPTGENVPVLSGALQAWRACEAHEACAAGGRRAGPSQFRARRRILPGVRQNFNARVSHKLNFPSTRQYICYMSATSAAMEPAAKAPRQQEPLSVTLKRAGMRALGGGVSGAAGEAFEGR